MYIAAIQLLAATPSQHNSYCMKKMLLPLFILTICSSFSCGNPEPEDYLIPKGFIGRATVIFNQKQGDPPKYENGRRVYKIPPNGICLTQCTPEYGIINHRFFYIDSSGARTQLPIYDFDYNKDGTTRNIVQDKERVGIFNDGTVGQYDEDDKAPFQFFFVATEKGLDTIETFDHFHKRINKIIGTNL